MARGKEIAATGILGSWIASGELHQHRLQAASLFHQSPQAIDNASTILGVAGLVLAIGLIAGTIMAERRAEE